MLLLSVLCLFAPFPLLLIETFLPWPFLVEEFFKFFVVQKLPPKNNYFYPIVLGILFSLSESVLYLSNFFRLGSFAFLPLRLLLTTSLHTSLFFLLYFFRSRRYLSILSLLSAIIIHYLYNLFIPGLF